MLLDINVTVLYGISDLMAETGTEGFCDIMDVALWGEALEWQGC